MTYDFYAFGLNGFNAKTNFSYTSKEVMRMIESYFETGSFDPTRFEKSNEDSSSFIS